MPRLYRHGRLRIAARLALPECEHVWREEAARIRAFICRNAHGLFSKHLDPATGELWGNFVQTSSMVGLISCAIRLSLSWDAAF